MLTTMPGSTPQAVAKPPLGVDVHTNPPVKKLGHSQIARGAEVAENCQMASWRDPRAHEKRYVNADKLIVHQTSRAPRRALRVRRGGRDQLTDEWDDSVVSGVKPAFASKLLNLREGRALERRKTQHKVGW